MVPACHHKLGECMLCADVVRGSLVLLADCFRACTRWLSGRVSLLYGPYRDRVQGTALLASPTALPFHG